MDVQLIKLLVSQAVHLIPAVPLLMLLCVISSRLWPLVTRRLLTLLLLLLLACSSPAISNLLVDSLEKRTAPLIEVPTDSRLILVLGAGHYYNPARPANSIVSAAALARVTEAARLWHTRSEAVLITSGRSSHSPVSHARAMADVAIDQGVPPSNIELLEEPVNTEQEIDAAARLFNTRYPSGDGRIVIVSSATHLPRAAQLLKPYNIKYTLAPTDFLLSTSPWYRLSAGHLWNSDRVIHEYIGMLWNWLRH